uniref:DNA-directed DNA polymerase n=1 Tax=viral metagenome TaxID=1070528 RepID=A0A6C0JZA2_9ZZZZ
MEHVFRLYDFNVYNKKGETKEESGSDEDSAAKSDTNNFVIQMFGINEKGDSCSILAENFKPFFYVKVSDKWTQFTKSSFLEHITKKLGKYYEKSISDCKIIKRKKLYGFDCGKEHKFIMFQFTNLQAFNKAKNLWYNADRKLLESGLIYANTPTYLYEANIPPLLRFFHIKEISPSGWVALPKKKTVEVKTNKETTCKYEFTIDYKNILPLNEKETPVPYKICSFDIEASSSHGDFPIPVKFYKKLSTNIIEHFEKFSDLTPEICEIDLRRIVRRAFGFNTEDKAMNLIDLVFPKKKHVPNSENDVMEIINSWLKTPLEKKTNDVLSNQLKIESMFENINNDEEEDAAASFPTKGKTKKSESKKHMVADVLCDKTLTREEKLNQINASLSDRNSRMHPFPELEGDKVTFIGSTFLRAGEKEPYLNHCIVLNTCGKVPVDNCEIESYKTEREVLLAWTRLIQREDPDIVIGYNIFGFDYAFMFNRAQENGCVREFLRLSKNKNEICGEDPFNPNTYKLEETSLKIASGQHDLQYIKMNGRVQIDLYNYFRREENLTSYKLDYVAGHFIGDYVKSLESSVTKTTTVYSGNLTGLLVGSYVHFEEIGHSVDYYSDGAKFSVVSVNKAEKTFIVSGIISPDMTKKVRWCLAKDDVTPKDIFRMTNGTDDDRAVIAKYCIQDCNLVHYLLNKSDVLTGFVEMAKICSVPISFLVLRGQGIKLTSYVAKKCREKRTLMPVLEKLDSDDGYEGAIVLDPKCDLYLDNPVACVDYASLYPSSMISENLSHDSKVWTKEYNLKNELTTTTGETDDKGNFLYDNLPNHEYVDITYDTFKYVRKTPSAAAEKIKSGYKICRFAQFPDNARAIMPAILEELLLARKTTRKLIPQQTDDFMKNVFDKRQIAYKLTANSLYGQCGARTSTFYEKDIAASTTATGRLLLTYAKKIIENTYGNRICDTSKFGKVLTKAEYIYGDTDSIFFTFNLQTPEGVPIRGKDALEITIELAQEAGHLASSFLKNPHDLEYEKTFMPFCLLSKKRYVGMLYEHDPDKCKRKEMGIVLKRRDNAPIVKDIYGGIIDILMKQKDIKQATEFLKSCLKNIVEENYPMDKLVITKSLRSGYKNPKQIAHKVLADRITARDPGNKPSSGDRIPFVYVHHPNKKALQGDKIETPAYIKENNLKIDYSFYITNQIMKPVQQVFALVLEKMWEMQNKKSKIAKFRRDVETLQRTTDPEKFEDKLESMKNKEVKALLFDEFLRETNNQKEGNQSLMKFFK